MRQIYYRRDGQPAKDALDAFGSGDTIVQKTTINDVEVSTVFLGIDHNHRVGAPILFETMLFCADPADPRHNALTRYHTETQALAGHDQAVAALRSGESLGWF